MCARILTVAALFPLLLQGCMSFTDNYQNNSYAGFAIRPLGTKIGDRETHTLSTYMNSCQDSNGEITNIAASKKNGENTPPKIPNREPKSACLSNAISAAIQDSDFLCMSHLKSIYGNDAAFNIATGSLATFTSGWAAITNGGSAKLLSAISAFSNAERSLVNETIYRNQVTTHIGIKISQAREDKGAAIRASLGDDKYNLAQATFDLMAYHNSCSFHYGLERVLQEGTNTNPAAKISQLEIEQDNLLRQIQLHIKTTDLKITDDNATSKDIVYMNLKSRLAKVEARINVLRDAGVSSDSNSGASKGSAVGDQVKTPAPGVGPAAGDGSTAVSPRGAADPTNGKADQTAAPVIPGTPKDKAQADSADAN